MHLRSCPGGTLPTPPGPERTPCRRLCGRTASGLCEPQGEARARPKHEDRARPGRSRTRCRGTLPSRGIARGASRARARLRSGVGSRAPGRGGGPPLSAHPRLALRPPWGRRQIPVPALGTPASPRQRPLRPGLRARLPGSLAKAPPHRRRNRHPHPRQRPKAARASLAALAPSPCTPARLKYRPEPRQGSNEKIK